MGKIRTSEFRYAIGDIFKDENRNFVVIEREYRKIERVKKDGSKINENQKWYKLKCNNCGWTNCWMIEHSLTNGNGCSCCHSLTVVEGINDIPTTAPWMVKFFQGGYDEAKNYTYGSSTKLHFICPDCGEIKKNKVQIQQLYNKKKLSCTCGDGYSYPEKFVYYLLNQLNVDFIYQLQKDNFGWCNNFRYDFYLPTYNCIIEAHGGQHYNKPMGYYKKLILQQQIDEEKQCLAKSNGIDNYIIIDCQNSTFDWIKDNITNSGLLQILNVNSNNIDWYQIEELALSNMCKTICEYKKRNPEKTTTEIAKIFKLNYGTISIYLTKGNRLNWCYYNKKEELSKRSKKNGKAKGKMVQILKNGEILGTHNSCNELERDSVNKYGVSLRNQGISKACNTGRPYKGYMFRYLE